MKRAILAATALLSSSIISSPAWADTIPTPTAADADATTLAAMQSQCNALAAAHDTANGDIWSGVVVPGDVTLVSGPTEVGSTRIVDEDTIVGTGTFVPSTKEIRGNPFRTGGSVNLFGDQWATAGYYPDSTYNYTADFASTFAHAFSCNIYDAYYHPEVPGAHHDAVPVQGHYVNCDFGHGQGNDNGGADVCADIPATQASCIAHNNTGPSFGQWGEDTEQCKFIKTADAQDAYDDPPTPAYNDEVPTLIGNEPGVTVNQDQTDSLDAFEDHGGVVQVTGEYHIGQVVICISPGSKGGSWRAQNGYSGGSFTGPAAGCNTPYFKIAPWGNGSQTSNGVWTSVPNYYL